MKPKIQLFQRCPSLVTCPLPLAALLLLFTFHFSLPTPLRAQLLKYSKVITSDSMYMGGIKLLPDGSLLTLANVSHENTFQMSVGRLDALGNPLWTRQFGGGVFDQMTTTTMAPTGEVYICADTRSYGAGQRDIIIAKLDTAGNILWSQVVGGPGEDGGRGMCVAANGDLIVVGVLFGMGLNSNNIMFLRFDPAGNLLTCRMMGDPNNQSVYEVEEIAPERFLVTGNHLAGGTNMDILLMLVDSTGTPIWKHTYDSGTWDRFVAANAVHRDAASGNITVGFRPGGNTWTDPTLFGILQVDSLGNIQFARTFDAPAGECNNMLLTDSGFVLFGRAMDQGGHFRGCAIAVNDTGLPMQAWYYMEGRRSSLNQIQAHPGGGYLLTGAVAMEDTTRNGLWIQKTGPSLIACNDSAFIATATTLPMTMGSPAFTIIDTGFIATIALQDTFISVTDTLLCYTCPLPVAAFNWTALGLTVTFSNASTGTGTHYLWDFGDGNTDTAAVPTHTYSTYGTYQVCLFATNECGTDTFCQAIDLLVTTPEAIAHPVKVHPNPFHDRIMVSGLEAAGPVEIQVLNTLGSCLLSRQWDAALSRQELQLPALPRGCYYLQVKGEGWHQTLRIIKL